MAVSPFIFLNLNFVKKTLAVSPADCDGDLEDEDQQSPLTQLSVSSEMGPGLKAATVLSLHLLWPPCPCQQTHKSPDYF